MLRGIVIYNFMLQRVSDLWQSIYLPPVKSFLCFEEQCASHLPLISLSNRLSGVHIVNHRLAILESRQFQGE